MIGAIWNIFITVFRAGVGFLKFVVVPLSIIALVIMTVQDYKMGIKRRFAGSRLVLVGSLCILAVWYGRPDIYKRLENAEFITYYNLAVWSFGYLLYFFSCRVPNYEEARQARKEKKKEDWRNSNRFTYTETTWSDGSVTNDYTQKQVANKLAIPIYRLIQIPFAPLICYFNLFFDYLMPLIVQMIQKVGGENQNT